MATIITKNSSTASSVPLNTQLVQGELAVNVTDKRLFTENASGTVVELGTNPSTLVTSNTFLAFGRGNTEDMRLTSTGLGIGTSLPNEKLVVNGAVRSSSNAAAVTASAGAVMDYYSGMARFFATDGSAVGQMNLDKAGNLGLGVTPSTYSQGKAIDINTNMGAWASGSGAIWSYNTYFNSGYKYKTSDVAAMYVQGSQHQWHVAASGTAGNAISFTQAMTLDASGNLGVGTTSPSEKFVVSASSGYVAASVYSGSGNIRMYASGTDTGLQNTQSGGFITFQTNSGSGATERARIDSSGNLLVGTTSLNAGERLCVVNSGAGKNTAFFHFNSVDDRAILTMKHAGSSGGTSRAHIRFENDVGTQVGNITVSGSATAYNTSSDYRLKNTIAPMTGALAKVAALKPCTYKWNADGSDGEGFIAHELAEVCPQAVTGEKDAVDAEGKPVYQGIDTSFLVATLTAAIQELKASLDEVKLEFDAYKAAHP